MASSSHSPPIVVKTEPVDTVFEDVAGEAEAQMATTKHRRIGSQPVSPIVMGFDPSSHASDAMAMDTVLKSLDLKREQEALIKSRRAGGGSFDLRSTTAACVRLFPDTADCAETRSLPVAARRTTAVT